MKKLQDLIQETNIKSWKALGTTDRSLVKYLEKMNLVALIDIKKDVSSMNSDCEQMIGPCTCGAWHYKGELNDNSK